MNKDLAIKIFEDLLKWEKNKKNIFQVDYTKEEICEAIKKFCCNITNFLVTLPTN